MNILSAPRALIFLGVGLLLLLFLSLAIGIFRGPAGESPASAPASSSNGGELPSAAPPNGLPEPAAAPAMPAPSALRPAASPAAAETGSFQSPSRPPAFPVDSPEGLAMRPGHLEVVKLNSDPFQSGSQYVTVLSQESSSGSQSTLDGSAARSAASLPDVDGIQVSKRGYILIQEAGPHDLMLQSVSKQNSWLSHAECNALIGGTSVARAAPSRIATATVTLGRGWHEAEIVCTRTTGSWQATLAIRAPGASAPEIQALHRATRAQPTQHQQEGSAMPVGDTSTSAEPSEGGS
jgi:hypothetical protein